MLLVTSLLIACSDQKSAESAAKNKAAPAKELTAEENVTKWRKDAEAGNTEAQQNLGDAYHYGKGVPKDDALAVAWWRKAAEQGSPDAQHRLGQVYDVNSYYGLKLGVPKDTAQAMMWYRKAAEQGHAGAQFGLGLIYANGDGVPKDAAQAVVWYLKAAKQGNVDSQVNLGAMYDDGEGVPKDAAQAVAWWYKAAEQGDKDGQSNLGNKYYNGDGVPKDAAQAVVWYRKAAEQGQIYARIRLANMYWRGQGVLQDKVRAYMWLNLAAAQGDEEAIRGRDKAEAWMAADQIAEAQRLTREWKPGQHTDSKARYSGIAGGALEKELVGTAFVVSSQGHLLTNRHVVGNCQQVRLAGSDKPLKVLPQDEANDLALLQMTDKPRAVAVFRAANDLRQGENIAAYGYPLQGTLAAGGNLSPGVVSALAGLGNNTSQIQITAPVQQGNSGGPLLDGKGQVVGVVVQKLNALKVAKLTGDVPQNVNFAINKSTTLAFLDSNQVEYKTGNWWDFWQKDLADIAEDARTYTVVVECWK
ncbi:MAG TPA: tetratricopeptide repeat-containing serine protease family protein [Thiobacillus sp.]|mgnify:CR=1 FL=1|nr:tetratricopeptide repeat-containing serine protease family protein [Thiobacillus sp.]